MPGTQKDQQQVSCLGLSPGGHLSHAALFPPLVLQQSPDLTIPSGDTP